MGHNGTYIKSEQKRYNSRHLIPNIVPIEVRVQIHVLLLTEYIDVVPFKTPVQVRACFKAITAF
jgi:hypothetical protein